MSWARRSLPALGAGLAVAGMAAACSSPVPTPTTVAAPVPASIVPAKLPAESLTLQPNTTREVQQAVRSVGPQLLASSVELWEIHSGDQLIGALQLSTLKSRVHPARSSDRNSVIDQILLGPSEELDIDGLPVWTTPGGAATGRNIYIWFGAHAFGVLQLSSQNVDPSKVANDLITRIATQKAWDALPPQDYQES